MAETTEITEIENLRNQRVRITLENGTRYVLLKSALRERPMEIGHQLDPEEFANWVLLRQYPSALEKAVAMLAARACSKGEIQQKLRQTGYSAETTEMVMLKLEKNDLVDDQDFANQWTQSRVNRSYGPRRISQQLRQKGVSAEETESAIAEIPEEELLEQAMKVARKGLRSAKSGEDPRKVRQRVLSSLARRGYDWDLSRVALDKALQGIDPSFDE